MAELKKAEAAKLLDVSERSLERAVKAGKLHPRREKKPGGGEVLYFDDDDLRAWQTAPKVDRTYEELERRDTSTDGATAGALERFMRLLAPALGDGRSDSRSVGVTISDLAQKPLLTLAEAQTLTGLSRGILRAAIDGGTLKGKVIGRAWRIKRADLDAYVGKL